MTPGFRSSGKCRSGSGASTRTLGKIGNCQIGVSITAATEDASCPLNWRLFIPAEWDEQTKFNENRREKAKLPEDVQHVEKWRQALEMIDELLSWGIKPSLSTRSSAGGSFSASSATPKPRR